MDKYKTLAFSKNLYPRTVINNFASSVDQWNLLSDRKKELALLKINCNILLCNLELLEESQEGKKRRLSHDIASECIEKTVKRPKILCEENQTKETEDPIPSTSKETNSSDLTETWDDEDDETDFYSDPTKYRFQMIKYMDNPAMIQSFFCTKWGYEKTDLIWDIVDKKDHIFIKVEITSDANKAKLNFSDSMKTFNGKATLCVVDPFNVKIIWPYNDQNLKSEEKVLNFLLKRKAALDSLQILETDLQNAEDLKKEIFTSDYFNKGMREWINDWNKESYETYSYDDLYSEEQKYPKTIGPSQLISLLSNLEEDNRQDNIKYKGKISPEGWVYNIRGKWEKDSEI
ncbi:hypothetical protein ABEB36_000259 [Hypothenemus hampei]|uniref:Uncharacterized protein n=1 Tax=Hypothenemus hampei TaxID=57062 RepID=A0ABD1FAQ4_HYPHA